MGTNGILLFGIALSMGIPSLTSAQFGPQQGIGIQDGAHCALAVDLDQDGDNDVVVAAAFADQVVWYANDGMGNFGTANLIAFNHIGVRCLNVADVDGDGDPDLLCADNTDGHVTFLRNMGGGMIWEEYPAAILMDAMAVSSGDLDGDGDVDVVSITYDGLVGWSQNLGGNQFSLFNLLGISLPGRAVVVCDLDGDGDLDVVSTGGNNWDGGKVVWFENNGAGVFSSVVIISTSWAAGAYLATADLDNDGDLDIVGVGNNASGTFDWFENAGDGTFGPAQYISSDLPETVTCSDLDMDGFPDVLFASGSTTIGWYHNEGDGTFSEEMDISDQVNGARWVDAGDLNGNGTPDVISASWLDDKVAWYGNTMSPLTTHVDPGSGSAPCVLHAFLGSYGNDLLLNCTFPITSSGRVDLISIQGELLRTLSGNGTRDLRIPCGDLSPGIYMVRVIESGRNTAVTRMVVP